MKFSENRVEPKVIDTAARTGRISSPFFGQELKEVLEAEISYTISLWNPYYNYRFNDIFDNLTIKIIYDTKEGECIRLSGRDTCFDHSKNEYFEKFCLRDFSGMKIFYERIFTPLDVKTTKNGTGFEIEWHWEHYDEKNRTQLYENKYEDNNKLFKKIVNFPFLKCEARF